MKNADIGMSFGLIMMRIFQMPESRIVLTEHINHETSMLLGSISETQWLEQ